MTTTRTAPYVVVPASPILGAEIVGVDLANGVDEATADALREDFWRHKVLVFRNQHLSPDAHATPATRVCSSVRRRSGSAASNRPRANCSCRSSSRTHLYPTTRSNSVGK